MTRWPAVALLLLTVTACRESAAPTATPEDIGRYVALGDSYSSGAGLPETVAEAGGCQRSRLSYPALVADELGARLVDVTCGGAGTVHLTDPQHLGDGSTVPPQLDAVPASADLVTVGLGFNDHGWYGGLLFGCTSLAERDPAGHPCRDAAASNPDPELVAGQVGAQVAAALEAVGQRAPRARVLLVGYPQLVPATGTCDALPLADGDYAYVRSMMELLDDDLRRAADAAGATYVDVLGASRGHDVCAGDEAWVNGVQAQPGVAASYHPFARGQRAVAELVLQALAVP